MLIGKTLFFSKNYTFKDFKNGDKQKRLAAFQDRVYSLYIDPINILIENEAAFGAGVISVSLIDCFVRVMFRIPRSNPDSYKKWLKSNINDFCKDDYAKRFYEDFRCGLVHEGRIKKAGQFTFSIREIIKKENGIFFVNPSLLSKKLIDVFEEYLILVENNSEEYNKFEAFLLSDFKEDFKHV